MKTAAKLTCAALGCIGLSGASRCGGLRITVAALLGLFPLCVAVFLTCRTYPRRLSTPGCATRNDWHRNSWTHVRRRNSR